MAPTKASGSSSSSYTQAKRSFRFECPLGKDALMVTAFVAEESVSRPFRMTVDLLSTDAAVDPAKLLRQPVSLVVDLVGGGSRTIHGRVSRFVQLGREDGLTHYRADVVPWLWFLSLSRDCRIFQQMSVPEICEAVFRKEGYTDVQFKLLKSYPKRDYCVQYRESHLDFISRLLEDEGIFYFFEHANDKHTLVLADAPSAVKPCPGLKGVRMNTLVGESYDQNVLYDLAREHAVHVGKVALTDFNFETPTGRLLAPEGDDGKGEAFDYPGGYRALDDGDRLARIRLEEQEALQQTVRGSGNVRAFVAGGRFDLTDHYRKDANVAYQLLQVRHVGRTDRFRTDGSGDEYSNEFVAIPLSIPYRPPRSTPRPRVFGSQTAIVVGKAGEEIWVDKYGRVKVQFHWDREGRKDENSSCWVRVSSTWAGKQWGFIQLPRIGQEVIVDFLEGDPDQPIVTGRVYNGDNMPPFDLPANQTQSGLRTRSSKGGGAANCNELRFEDKKGSEQVFLHAEKDHVVEVENNETWSVGNDRSKTIGNDETVHVKHDRTETVDNNESISIGVDRTEKVGANETITIGADRTEDVGGNETISVSGDQSLTIGGKREVTIGGDESHTVGGKRSTTIASDERRSIGGNHATEISKDALIKATKEIMIQAGSELTLKCGGSKIVMKMDGTIQIEGVQVTVKGSGKLTAEGGATAEFKSTGVTVVKGTMVMIN